MNLPNQESARPLQLLLLYYIFFLFFPSAGFSQHSYELKTFKEIPLLTAGAGGTVASIWLRSKNKPLTIQDLGNLQINDILAIDQVATLNYGEDARIASDIFLAASYAFPMTTLLIPEIRSDPLTIGVMLGEAILINETLTGITKAVFRRPRPFTYNQNVPENIRTEAASNYSFFSGHTSYVATLSFFTAKVIADNLENEVIEAIAWSGAFIWPAATGFFRYKAGMHFPTDVITGYTVGAAIGYFIPHLHKIRKSQKQEDSHAQINRLHIGPNFFQMVIVF